MWQRKFPFKVLIAIFLDLQPLRPSSLTKPDLLKFRCFSGHVLSKTKSVTPHFFTFLKSLTHYLSMVTLRDRGSLLFLLGERREERLLATARFFDLAAVHGQGRIN